MRTLRQLAAAVLLVLLAGCGRGVDWGNIEDCESVGDVWGVDLALNGETARDRERITDDALDRAVELQKQAEASGDQTEVEACAETIAEIIVYKVS